eukprot:Colp12_sorted_trinity150504_noHs@6004
MKSKTSPSWRGPEMDVWVAFDRVKILKLKVAPQATIEALKQTCINYLGLQHFHVQTRHLKVFAASDQRFLFSGNETLSSLPGVWGSNEDHPFFIKIVTSLTSQGSKSSNEVTSRTLSYRGMVCEARNIVLPFESRPEVPFLRNTLATRRHALLEGQPQSGKTSLLFYLKSKYESSSMLIPCVSLRGLDVSDSRKFWQVFSLRSVGVCLDDPLAYIKHVTDMCQSKRRKFLLLLDDVQHLLDAQTSLRAHVLSVLAHLSKAKYSHLFEGFIAAGTSISAFKGVNNQQQYGPGPQASPFRSEEERVRCTVRLQPFSEEDTVAFFRIVQRELNMQIPYAIQRDIHFCVAGHPGYLCTLIDLVSTHFMKFSDNQVGHSGTPI